MANDNKNDIRKIIRSRENVKSRERGGGLRKGRGLRIKSKRRNANPAIPNHSKHEHVNMVEMLNFPFNSQHITTLYTLMNRKDISNIRKYNIGK